MEQPLTYIVPLYAILFAALWIYATLAVIRLRFKFSIGIGHKNNSMLEQQIRAHGNFCETAPFGLLILFICAQQSPDSLLLHLWGMSLFLGRVLHFIGLSKTAGRSRPRVLGMLLTMFSILGASITALIYSFL